MRDCFLFSGLPAAARSRLAVIRARTLSQRSPIITAAHAAAETATKTLGGCSSHIQTLLEKYHLKRASSATYLCSQKAMAYAPAGRRQMSYLARSYTFGRTKDGG